jgi:hypothetical protein
LSEDFNQQWKNILLAMIVPELKFLEIEREAIRRDAVVLMEPFFGKTPEALKTVDVNPTFGESLGMVDLEMAVAAKHEAVIGLEPVGINHATSSDGLDGKGNKSLCGDIRNDLDKNLPLTFKDPEYRDFSCGASPATTLAAAPEVGFIQFYFFTFTRKSFLFSILGDNGHADDGDSLVGRLVTDTELLGHLPGRNLQLEEFDHAEPLGAGKATLAEPTASQLPKGVLTAAAPPSSVGQAVQFSTPASWTNALLEIEAKSQHVFSRRGFT